MSLEFLEGVETFSQLDPINYQYFHNLLNRRTILLNSEINESIIETIYMPLKEFEADSKEDKVTLILNTVGGSIADGLMLCNVIDNYKKPLDIIVPSYSCSMGTIILCAGSNNPNVTKYCYPFSFALFHSGETFLTGETASVEDIVDFNKKNSEKIKQYVISHTKIPDALYDEHARKQWYLTAEDMFEYGLVDKIIGCDK